MGFRVESKSWSFASGKNTLEPNLARVSKRKFRTWRKGPLRRRLYRRTSQQWWHYYYRHHSCWSGEERRGKKKQKSWRISKWQKFCHSKGLLGWLVAGGGVRTSLTMTVSLLACEKPPSFHSIVFWWTCGNTLFGDHHHHLSFYYSVSIQTE